MNFIYKIGILGLISPSLIADRRHSLFDHICRLPENTPASQACTATVNRSLHWHSSCRWLEASAGSSTKNLVATSGRRHWPVCWCCPDCKPRTKIARCGDATTLSWSSAAVSEWVVKDCGFCWTKSDIKCVTEYRCAAVLSAHGRYVYCRKLSSFCSMALALQVVEYDRPSVLLENSESVFSRLMEASKVDDTTDVTAVVQPATDAPPSVSASVWSTSISFQRPNYQGIKHLSCLFLSVLVWNSWSWRFLKCQQRCALSSVMTERERRKLIRNTSFLQILIINRWTNMKECRT